MTDDLLTYEPEEVEANIYASTRPYIEVGWGQYDASFMTFEDFFQRYGEYGYDMGEVEEIKGQPILALLVNNEVYNLNLDTLPPLYETLKWLKIIDNDSLTALTFPKNLETFMLHGGMIPKLPPFPKTLKTLEINHVRTTIVLPKLPDSITKLKLVHLKIDSLPNLPKGLEYFKCEETNLTELDLPKSLKVLKCGLNKLKHLNLPKGLIKLYSYQNPIEHLDIADTQIEELRFSHSPLWSISEFPATLQKVALNNNSLYKLPDSFYAKKYDELNIAQNPFTDETLTKLRKYARSHGEKALFRRVLSLQKTSAKLHDHLHTYKKSKTRVCVKTNSGLADLGPEIIKFFGGSVRKTKKKV